MKNVYLALTVVGSVLPWAVFWPHFADGATAETFTTFLAHMVATPTARAFTADLMISSAVFLVWSFVTARRESLGRWWIFPILNLSVGLSCALPLFLYVRERRRGAA